MNNSKRLIELPKTAFFKAACLGWECEQELIEFLPGVVAEYSSTMQGKAEKLFPRVQVLLGS